MKKPALEERLLRVSTEVSSGCHGDVGTDHGLLPLYLTRRGLCDKVIATEKSSSAYKAAKNALWGSGVDLRFGDGLEPFEEGELQSVSLCGMGGGLAAEILKLGIPKLPSRVVVQANRDSWRVRQWGVRCGYHLIREQLIPGRWMYEVLTFEQLPGVDPAYLDTPVELGLYFGPHLLREQNKDLEVELRRRAGFLAPHPRNAELRRVRHALDFAFADQSPTS